MTWKNKRFQDNPVNKHYLFSTPASRVLEIRDHGRERPMIRAKKRILVCAFGYSDDIIYKMVFSVKNVSKVSGKAGHRAGSVAYGKSRREHFSSMFYDPIGGESIGSLAAGRWLRGLLMSIWNESADSPLISNERRRGHLSRKMPGFLRMTIGFRLQSEVA